MGQEDYSIIPVDISIYNNSGIDKMFQFYKSNFEIKLKNGSNIKIRTTSSLELAFYKSLNKDYTVVEDDYVVTFNLNYEGSTAITTSVIEGQKVSQPADPIRTGYTFICWNTWDDANKNAAIDEDELEEFDFDDVILENITLYASWEINTYIVTFNYNYDEADEPFTTDEVDYNETVLEPIPDPEHGTYEFGGWYENALGTGNPFNFATPITGNKTLYAVWGNEVNLNLNYTEADEPYESQFVLEGAKAVEPIIDPTREGHTFTGWFEEEGALTPFDFDEVITVATEIYAGWEEDI